MARVDRTDARILLELVRAPRLTVSELAERVGVARNTAQSRLDRLHETGVLGSNDRGVALKPLGFAVSAVIAIDIDHKVMDETVDALEDNPSVLEVEEIAGGTGDLLVRVAARDTEHLQEVVHTVLVTPGVVRTNTMVVLKARVPYRLAPLLEQLGR